jgi:hypothetical protein
MSMSVTALRTAGSHRVLTCVNVQRFALSRILSHHDSTTLSDRFCDRLPPVLYTGRCVCRRPFALLGRESEQTLEAWWLGYLFDTVGSEGSCRAYRRDRIPNSLTPASGEHEFLFRNTIWKNADFACSNGLELFRWSGCVLSAIASSTSL